MSLQGLWGVDPSRPGTAYRNVLVQASLLGRAYALLAGQNVEIDNPYLRDLEEDEFVGVEWTNTSCMELDRKTADVKRQTAETPRREFEAHMQYGGGGHMDHEDLPPLSIFAMLSTKLCLQVYEIYINNLHQLRRFWFVYPQHSSKRCLAALTLSHLRAIVLGYSFLLAVVLFRELDTS